MRRSAPDFGLVESQHSVRWGVSRPTFTSRTVCVLAAGREILELCVAVGGSISGEHGIGTEKVSYMSLLFNDADLDFMKAIKNVWNPTDLLNPSKILPTSASCGEAVHLPSVTAVPGAWI